MKRNGVVFTPEAQEQLAELYRYIEENAKNEARTTYSRSIRLLQHMSPGRPQSNGHADADRDEQKQSDRKSDEKASH
jgi:plasmid stabilization system protein ParE